jgi:hypothetical protein
MGPASLVSRHRDFHLCRHCSLFPRLRRGELYGCYRHAVGGNWPRLLPLGGYSASGHHLNRTVCLLAMPVRSRPGA